MGKRRDAGGAPALPGKRNAMTIQSLTIQGYRTLKDVTWTPGRLNVLIGPNGSGKSNLLKALRLLKSCAEGRMQATLIDEGGGKAVSWDESGERICFSMNYSSPEDVPFGIPDNYHFFYKIGFFGHAQPGIFNEHLDVIVNNKQIFVINRKLLSYGEVLLHDGATLRINTTQHTESLLSQNGPGSSSYQDSAAAGFNWHLYFAFDTRQGAEVRKPAVSRLEKTVDDDGANLTPVLHTLYNTDRDFKRALNAAMSAAFGPDYDELVFPPAADQMVQLRIRWHSLRTEQSMANLSDGTIRFLALATILLNPDPPPLIAIDEPELGLHPRMFSILADLAAEASKKTQVVFATHSPQFLDAVGRHHPTTTVTGWEDGATTLSVLDPEELATWLQTYTLGELFTSGDLEAMK